MRQINPENSGFSLLEMLIAMTILVIGVLAVLGTFPSLLNLNHKSWENVEATTLAQETMQEILAGVYPNGSLPTCSCPCTIQGGEYSDPPGPNFHANYHAFEHVKRSWTVQCAPSDPSGTTNSNLYWVTVAVQWDNKQGHHYVTLNNYISH